jgi:3-isopropylmalate dehydratase small subunit
VHTIQPARLKPGNTLASLPGARPAEAGPKPGEGVLLRGRALIFWDPKVPGKKLDAIDTDQITPAADCVSESLDTLDERWKAGSFRYLMPDFRARVHRGETFLIAGDRFAIGSSREMSPAGLKGVAEEARLELVVVCGHNMGDIFRRNAFNLGLHVVQSPEAVADAQDGDTLTFDPVTRQLANETRGKTYQPLPLTPKEEEIRIGGGIFVVGRREFRASVEHAPAIIWPDAATARGMTSTEQIVWAHRVDKQAEVRPGATLRVYADLLPASDGTAPFAIHTFNRLPAVRTIDPRQAAIANDHFVFTGKEADERQTSIGREFAKIHGLVKPYYATPGDGIFHFYFPEQGLVVPGAFIPGADSHSRAYGAYGAVGMGVGSTTLGFGWSTGYIYFTLAKAAARRVRRRAAAVGERQGHRAGPAQAMGIQAVAGHVGGVRGHQPPAADRLPQYDREHDGRGRGAERHLRRRRHHRGVVSREGDDEPALSARGARRQRALRTGRDTVALRCRADDRAPVQSRECVPRR